MENPSELYQAILDGDSELAVEEANRLLTEMKNEEGETARQLLENHLIPAMNEAGKLFEEGDYFVPELLLAAQAMKDVMAILDPLLKAGGVEKKGTVFIGTVAGDQHDIGKNLVASMLEGGGFEVVDLGINVSPDAFIQAIQKTSGTVVLALSALLTTTMPQMKRVIDRLQSEGLRDRVKVMVGGAPVSQEFADQIGADGYSDSAQAAVELARRLAA